MSFAGKVWRLLVGIKDALSLAFLLLFFMALFAILSARPSPGVVRDGALFLQLDGSVVEEASAIDPLEALVSQQLPASQYQARDLVTAIDAAATDKRIKAVVLDLSSFTGGGHIHMQEIGAALDRVRKAKKPVLAFALAYTDDSMMLAAHASEVWVDPMGGAIIAGPGGDRLYLKGLLDYLKVNVRVYRVGTYKSAVEPYMRNDMSPEARENAQALYSSIWEEYKANFRKARPQADIDRVTKDTVAWLQASGGDPSKAALDAKLVDKVGDWEAFGKHVAGIVGADPFDTAPGSFAKTELKPWLAAVKPGSGGRSLTGGKTIGVITIAGEISDGDAGPGEAGGARISGLLDEALNDNLAALVVRVDSPGGTITGSEAIRRAILRHKRKGIPIVVSMGNYAASGGYWVSTPADRIFAEPETVTGSIGVYGVVPTFEKALGFWGVGSDGVRSTPLSGQPDILSGFTPEIDSVLQQTVEHEYGVFLSLVAKSRNMTPQQVDRIAQGRVWDGGTARQIGLVDQFGDVDAAIEWAAQKAGLKQGEWQVHYLGGGTDPYLSLIERLLGSESETTGTASSRDLFATVAGREEQRMGRAVQDLGRLLENRGAQAYCLECAPKTASTPQVSATGRFAALAAWLGR
ncbi:serine protease [Erythrobacter sp. SG61-1L]|uniref:signal peptide peptidase SppA n=1 Tax=Erythrobacter sp. SG61-1L TaxID=1603897 RepID=UPI0006C90001|nr:signal peptide peptidase SppA [Erythrobacter sp. SG61-1L]KPL69566.1 serine protease [Erythrobacter sp. SG61-1L]